MIATIALALAPTSLPHQDPIPADVGAEQVTASGLRYSVLLEGTGDVHPKLTDTVEVHYTGWLLDGTVFDSSRARNQSSSFGVSQVIAGWTEGLQLMNVGARYKFTIPAPIAYGDTGSPPKIPGGATLVFDVELLGITQGPPLPIFMRPDPEHSQEHESGFHYQLLSGGEGTPPGPNEVFSMRYSFWDSAGKLIDSSALSGRDLSGNPRQMSLGFLKNAALMLPPGGHLVAEVPAALAFGERALPTLPANSVTIWELEMVRVMRVPEFSMSAPENLKTTASGLQYEVLREGTGAKPVSGMNVQAHYAGWLTNGTLFDSSLTSGQPLTFAVGVGRVIAGWDEGLQLMQQGAIYKFTIPWKLAYGENGRGTIPARADLVFWVELLAVDG